MKNPKIHTRQQKDLAIAWVERWKPRLNLHQWDLTWTWRDSDKLSEDGDRLVAEIDARPLYFEADITIFPWFWADAHTDQYREKSLVHELSHCQTEQMDELICDSQGGLLVTNKTRRATNESLTQWITNIIWAAYQS